MKHLWLLALLAGCYDPQFVRCAVTCTAQEDCPGDTYCRSDGRCHEANDPSDCPPVPLQPREVLLKKEPLHGGDGRVTGEDDNPDMPEIDCGVGCPMKSAQVDDGTMLVFSGQTYSPVAGYTRLVSWTKPDNEVVVCPSNVDGPCTTTIVVQSDVTITATHIQQVQLTLRADSQLTNAGKVKVDKDRWNGVPFECDAQATCMAEYFDIPTALTLTAEPAQGFVVTWSGCNVDPNDRNVCRTEMTERRSVTATFDM